MEENDISIQITRATTWTEKFEKCDEIEIHQPNCQFSPCSRFSFTISGCYLDIVDTVCGARLRLKLDDSIQPINLLNYTLSGFYPTNRYSGVLFWTQLHESGIIFGKKCWKSFAARFQIDYECGVLCREGEPLQFKGLMRPLTVLDHGRIILTCEAKIYGDQKFEIPVNYTFRQFNLNTMQHFGPSINNRVVETCRHSLYSWCNTDMLTWYRDKIYHFNMLYGNEGLNQLRQQSSHIIEYSKNGRRRVKLDNYLACLDQGRENSISYVMVDRNFTTKWHKHLLFARISFPIQNPYLKLAFEQHFAVFNLETMRWHPLNINKMPISSIAPCSMSVTENTLVLVNSTAGQGFYLNRMFYHAKQKHHVQVGNHNHANVHRIPLNRPETLENLSLTTLNHLRPDWRIHATFLHSSKPVMAT
ncbi:hypothetical protein M3Y97_00653800 [Aphelenchoides bicaudatus]|nr:hypothetical protein M3Y97_00653800 [Aphelenchoides bicaudatus]